MAIRTSEALSLQPGDVIRIASQKEIDRTDKYWWTHAMYAYCDKEVVVKHVRVDDVGGGVVEVYMVPQEPDDHSYFFTPEWIAGIVDDEYIIQPACDSELQDFLFIKE